MIMKIFAIQTLRCNCIAAAGQTARGGTKLFIPLLTIALSLVMRAGNSPHKFSST